ACFDRQSFFRFASDARLASCPALLAASFVRFQKSFGICLNQRIRSGDGVTPILDGNRAENGGPGCNGGLPNWMQTIRAPAGEINEMPVICGAPSSTCLAKSRD